MRPLEGVRIIDLTVAVAGPVATSLLADLGAEVVRVEPPFARPGTHLDVAPHVPGTPDRPYNRLVGYSDLHRGKRAVTLDLSRAEGRSVLLRLAAISDAVVENMSPRVIDGLGIGYEALRAPKPDIVLVSMPAFGRDGPLRDRVAYGPGIDAASGLSWLTGYPDRGPMNPANYYADYTSGVMAALATIVALRHRDRTGEGQHVEAAMIDAELQAVGEALLDYTMNARVQTRTGNAHPAMSPHGVYASAGEDRWIAVACEDDAQWRAICHTIGRPELARDERYADVVSRAHRRDEIDAIVSAWTRDRGPHEAAEALQAAGVAASAVQTVPELLDDPQLAARGFVHRVRHAEAGEMPHMRAAFTLAGAEVGPDAGAPLYGEGTEYVFGDLLGMSTAQMAALEEAGVARREHPG
ncbi:MAG: CoA transferase [Dehalococcoidia bacterium]